MAIDLAKARARVETDLPDATLQTIIDAELEAINRKAGVSSQVESFLASGNNKIVLGRKPTSITTITERRTTRSDPVTLDTNDYREQSPMVLLRLTSGTNPASTWGEEVVVTYVVDQDDELRGRVHLDLIQLAVDFRSFESEESGDWKGSQKDYNKRRKELLNQIKETRRPFA